MGYHRKEHLGRGCECNHINMPPGIDPIGIDVKNHHEMILALCRQVKEIKDRIDNGGNTGSGGGATADEELRKELNTINLRIAALRTDVEDVENRLDSKRLIAAINSDTSGITIDKSKLDVKTEKMTGQEIVDAINKGASDKIDSSRLEINLDITNVPVQNTTTPGVNFSLQMQELQSAPELASKTYVDGKDKYLTPWTVIGGDPYYFDKAELPQPVLKKCIINGAMAAPSGRYLIYIGGRYCLTNIYDVEWEKDVICKSNEYFESTDGITFNKKTVAEPPLAEHMEHISSMLGILNINGKYYLQTEQVRAIEGGGGWTIPKMYIYESTNLTSWKIVTNDNIRQGMMRYSMYSKVVGNFIVMDGSNAMAIDGSSFINTKWRLNDMVYAGNGVYYTSKDNGDGTHLLGRSNTLNDWTVLKMFPTHIKHLAVINSTNSTYVLVFPNNDVIYIVNNDKGDVKPSGLLTENKAFYNGDVILQDGDNTYRFGSNLTMGDVVSKYTKYYLKEDVVGVAPLLPIGSVLLSTNASNPFTGEYIKIGSFNIGNMVVYAYMRQ